MVKYIKLTGEKETESQKLQSQKRNTKSDDSNISTTGNKVSLINLFALLYILQDIYRSSFSDGSSRKKSSDIVKISNGRSARSLNRTSSQRRFVKIRIT